MSGPELQNAHFHSFFVKRWNICDDYQVRARVNPSQTHDLKCDVLVNGKVTYLNFTEEKIKFFKNVYVTSPVNDRHQANITIMFNSTGVGVQVSCHFGMMQVKARRYSKRINSVVWLFYCLLEQFCEV